MTGADPGFEHRGHAEDYVTATHISTVKSLPIAVQVSLRAQETLGLDLSLILNHFDIKVDYDIIVDQCLEGGARLLRSRLDQTPLWLILILYVNPCEVIGHLLEVRLFVTRLEELQPIGQLLRLGQDVAVKPDYI